MYIDFGFLDLLLVEHNMIFQKDKFPLIHNHNPEKENDFTKKRKEKI